MTKQFKWTLTTLGILIVLVLGYLYWTIYLSNQTATYPIQYIPERKTEGPFSSTQPAQVQKRGQEPLDLAPLEENWGKPYPCPSDPTKDCFVE